MSCVLVRKLIGHSDVMRDVMVMCEYCDLGALRCPFLPVVVAQTDDDADLSRPNGFTKDGRVSACDTDLRRLGGCPQATVVS